MKKQNWEIEFDKKFSNTFDEDGLSIWFNTPTPKYIKQFISDLLFQSRQEAVEVVKKWALDKKKKCEKLVSSEYANESGSYFRGKIAILDDLLKSLSSNNLKDKQ